MSGASKQPHLMLLQVKLDYIANILPQTGCPAKLEFRLQRGSKWAIFGIFFLVFPPRTILKLVIPSPAVYFRKNREFRRVLAVFCANSRYICIFAIILHPLAFFVFSLMASPFRVILHFFLNSLTFPID